MALSRRTGQRFQSSIWPGFVDAMTGLLLVLMFVLTIFMVVQFVLRETISGQETELDTLSGEIAALAQALGLEQRRNTALSNQLGALESTLEDRDARLAEQEGIIAALTGTRDGLLTRRGRVEDTPQGPVFITVHPAWILRLRDAAERTREVARFREDIATVLRAPRLAATMTGPEPSRDARASSDWPSSQ